MQSGAFFIRREATSSGRDQSGKTEADRESGKDKTGREKPEKQPRQPERRPETTGRAIGAIGGQPEKAERAKLFLRIQSRCDHPQPDRLLTKRRQGTRCRELSQTTADLTTAGTAAEQRQTERPLPEHTRRQKGCPTVGFASQPGGVGAQSNARSVRLWSQPTSS